MEAFVWETVNAIDTQGLNPVVEPGDGFVYVLNTSQKVFATLLYTKFDIETRFPLDSYTVKYGHQHYIHQAIFATTMIRSKLDYIVDMDIPGELRADFDPMIIPGCTPTYPTEPAEPPKQTFL